LNAECLLLSRCKWHSNLTQHNTALYVGVLQHQHKGSDAIAIASGITFRLCHITVECGVPCNTCDCISYFSILNLFLCGGKYADKMHEVHLVPLSWEGKVTLAYKWNFHRNVNCTLNKSSLLKIRDKTL